MGSLAFISAFQRPLALDIQSLANMMVHLDISDPRRIIASVEARSTLLEQIWSRQFEDDRLRSLRESCLHSGGGSPIWVPVSIISDRGSHFTSSFWRAFQEELGTQVDLSTAFHPQTDGQSEQTIQVLEDILRACVLDFGGQWDQFLPLAEFAYNNSFHSSIQMAPFEALYGRRCRSPVCWFETSEARPRGTDLLRDLLDHVRVIQDRLQAVQIRQRSYADRRRRPLSFKVGDRVFLRVSPMKGVMRFGRRGKLSPRYIGPFEILQRVGEVAYVLALPPAFLAIHPVFHVSMLRQYIPDESHTLQWDSIQLDEGLAFVEEPASILARDVSRLHSRNISVVKVQWSHRPVEEATQEKERVMRAQYPYLFEPSGVVENNFFDVIQIRVLAGYYLEASRKDILALASSVGLERGELTVVRGRFSSIYSALHKAVRSQHLDVVKPLVTEDFEFEFPHNHAQETPLYLASESGFHGALINILISGKKPTYTADCIRSLWRWNKPLCEELDLWGWNSLHVKLGLQDIVSAMLGWKITLVYLPAGSENDWTTAIYIAASEGDLNIINKLLNHFGFRRSARSIYMLSKGKRSNVHQSHAVIILRKRRTHRIIIGRSWIKHTKSKGMESTLYNAAMRGNIGADNFLLADHLKMNEENGYYVTPKVKTVLQKNETALHIAANEGHTEVVHVLFAHIEDHDTKEKLTRMTGASGDTTLHKAVRSQHLDVVKILVKEDPEFEFPPNHTQEMPLYLEAESGFHDALIKILESCKKPIYAAGPSNRTPLHAAVIQEHKDCIRSLWRWNKTLCEELDLWGWNSLHYAVKLGLEDVVSDMLGWKKSLVYLPKGSENNWRIAIHIAASEGDEKLVEGLCSIGRFGKRDFEVKRKYEYMHNPNDETGTGVKMKLREVDHNKAKKEDQTEVESIIKAAQIHVVVATLIMTITFAAGITLPGGFESDSNSPNQGMEILIRKTTFRAFVVSALTTRSKPWNFHPLIRVIVSKPPGNVKPTAKVIVTNKVAVRVGKSPTLVREWTGSLLIWTWLAFEVDLCPRSILDMVLEPSPSPFWAPGQRPVSVGPKRDGGVRVDKSPTLVGEWTGSFLI
ncbi:putative peroxidase N-like [Capsicum annuum]|nr:putative peroxidase N-like [Capsicum annuum]